MHACMFDRVMVGLLHALLAVCVWYELRGVHIVQLGLTDVLIAAEQEQQLCACANVRMHLTFCNASQLGLAQLLWCTLLCKNSCCVRL